MKLATYIYEQLEQVGVVVGEQVVGIGELLDVPVTSMLDLIKQWQPEWLDQIGDSLQLADHRVIALSEVKLCAPIPFPPRNVFCLGKNYAEHAQEIKITEITDTNVPDRPIYFSKVASPAIGHGDIIRVSQRVSKQVDYEVELAVVIGQEGIDIKPEQAMEHVFGYTIGNDISARNLQAAHQQWFKGKSLDNFCPLGPVLVHKSALPFPGKLKIQCRVNGELRQDSNTSNLVFDIPYIISDLSQGMTLKPGDIILTGTPSGVGMGYDPPAYLHDGDLIECYIEGIGLLVNRLALV